jgi:hypothetical protein
MVSVVLTVPLNHHFSLHFYLQHWETCLHKQLQRTRRTTVVTRSLTCTIYLDTLCHVQPTWQSANYNRGSAPSSSLVLLSPVQGDGQDIG